MRSITSSAVAPGGKVWAEESREFGRSAVAAAQSCGCGGSLGARASGSGLGWFTEGFDTLDLKEAKALLDELAT